MATPHLHVHQGLPPGQGTGLLFRCKERVLGWESGGSSLCFQQCVLVKALLLSLDFCLLKCKMKSWTGNLFHPVPISPLLHEGCGLGVRGTGFKSWGSIYQM